MHSLDFLAWLGAAVAWWGAARYMVGIIRGDTQPRLASWIAWLAANSVLTAVAFLNNAHMAAIFNGLAALSNISVLAISGYKRTGKMPNGITDWACLLSAGICLLTILLFPRLTYMDAILAMSANLIATWPTIQHAWMRPHEETWQLFAANCGANLLGLVSVFGASGADLGNIAGPLVSMLGNISLLGITIGRNWLTSVIGEVGEEVQSVEQTIDETITELQSSSLDTE